MHILFKCVIRKIKANTSLSISETEQRNSIGVGGPRQQVDRSNAKELGRMRRVKSHQIRKILQPQGTKTEQIWCCATSD